MVHAKIKKMKQHKIEMSQQKDTIGFVLQKKHHSGWRCTGKRPNSRDGGVGKTTDSAEKIRLQCSTTNKAQTDVDWPIETRCNNGVFPDYPVLGARDEQFSKVVVA